MNVSCWIYPAVAGISLSIGTAQSDPKAVLDPPDLVDTDARARF